MALTTSRLISSASQNQMRKENVDVVGIKPVKNDVGEMSMSEEASRMRGLNITKGFSMLNLTGTLITCPTNRRWKAHLTQSLLTW